MSASMNVFKSLQQSQSLIRQSGCLHAFIVNICNVKRYHFTRRYSSNSSAERDKDDDFFGIEEFKDSDSAKMDGSTSKLKHPLVDNLLKMPEVSNKKEITYGSDRHSVRLDRQNRQNRPRLHMLPPRELRDDKSRERKIYSGPRRKNLTDVPDSKYISTQNAPSHSKSCSESNGNASTPPHSGSSSEYPANGNPSPPPHSSTRSRYPLNDNLLASSSANNDDKDLGGNFIDEQYFTYSPSVNPEEQHHKQYRSNNATHLPVINEPVDTDQNVETTSNNSTNEPILDEKNTSNNNFIDDQYFEYDDNKQYKTKFSTNDDLEIKNISSKLEESRTNLNTIDEQYFGMDMGAASESLSQSTNQDMSEVKSSKDQEVKDQVRMEKIKQSLMDDNVKKPNKPNQKGPEKAYDIAMKIRRELNQGTKSDKTDSETRARFSGPVDSKGFRILKHQVPNIMKTPSFMVVDVLKKSIVYDRDDIIAIDKPYGLPSHGGPGVHMSVGQLLPALAERLDPTGELSTLHLVHRLDKETTGVMLLARTSEMASELKGYFIRREVIKKYWAITKGVPKLPEGIINIPMAEVDMGKGIHRMALKPEYQQKFYSIMKKRNINESVEAVTQYKILQQNGTAALIECQPSTGVKHQIRVHLGFGLNTPILGDHKYSHFSKLVPQKLYGDMLQKLGIRQSKVRHVPMHLHAKSLVIPEFQDGRNLIVSAKLPQHFVTNMHRLKLTARR
ncbi:uncharacterized protein LOC126824300 [Patella vulgata]|uniref:uncharacterized protein LOC126824300 n=1 Tax=Patella vulgata TaxID=6465 RepID=UPI00217F4BA3|nr:uncharacterized protein LOC126824300 [Patella vulgata]